MSATGATQTASSAQGAGQAAGGFERLLAGSVPARDPGRDPMAEPAVDAEPLPGDALPGTLYARDDMDDWPPAGLSALDWSPALPQAPMPLPAAATPVPADPDADADALGLLPDGSRPAPPSTARLAHPSLAAAQAAAAQTAPSTHEEPLPAIAMAATASGGIDIASAGMEPAAPAPIALPGITLPSFGAFAAPLSSAQAAAAPADAGQAPPNLHGDDFADEFGARLHWMADQKIGHARIRLHPEELGAVDVRLRLDGDRVSADFISARPEVRQALEQSLPRLEELLGEHGFQLAHADVGQQQRDDDDASAEAGVAEQSNHAAGEDATVADAPLRQARGLVDAYA